MAGLRMVDSGIQGRYRVLLADYLNQRNEVDALLYGQCQKRLYPELFLPPAMQTECRDEYESKSRQRFYICRRRIESFHHDGSRENRYQCLGSLRAVHVGTVRNKGYF